MQSEFKLVRTESVFEQAQAVEVQNRDVDAYTLNDGRFIYKKISQLVTASPESDLFSIDDEYNSNISREWRKIHSKPAFIPAGEVHFNNVTVMGPNGLAVDRESGMAYIGDCVNWGSAYAKWYVEHAKIGFSHWKDELTFCIDRKIEADNLQNGVIMTSPGQEVFGHWIIDYAPRLFLLEQIQYPDSYDIFFPIIKPWMQAFIECFDVNIDRIHRLPSSACHFDHAVMPSGTKAGIRLARPIHQTAWERVRSHLLEKHLPKVTYDQLPKVRKIFVSRKNWNRSRHIENREDVERLATDRGYFVMTPETYSLQEQAMIFSSAEIIVGEDGSGLHNAIFMPRGGHLVVIMQPNRFNLWHAGVCEAMGHRIAYVNGQQVGDTVRADIAALNRVLDSIDPL